MKAALAILALWVMVVAVAIPFALRQGAELTGGGFDIAGSQSAAVERLLQTQVEVDFRVTALGAVLVRSPGASLPDADRALAALQAAARRVPGVDLPREVREASLYLARVRPRKDVTIPFVVSVDEFHAPDVASRLRRELELGHGGGRYGSWTLHLVGQGALWGGLLELMQSDVRTAETTGFPLIALILVLVFGSLLAASLPLAVGAATIVVTGAVVHGLSLVVPMSVYVPPVASMIGIGVAVDFALFVLVRFREEMRTGATVAAARSRAMATSGVAVLFSGAAIVVALGSLWLIDSAAVRSMAAGAMLVVAVAMLACWTLLPALLTLLGVRLAGRAAGSTATWSARWVAGVLLRPRLALGTSLTLLLALTAPMLGLQTRDGALRQFPPGNETRTGFDAARKANGPGRGAPVKLLVARGDVDRTVAFLRADPEVVRTGVRTQTADGRRILIIATPRSDGDSDAAKALVRRLRDRLPGTALVGGNSAAQVDFNANVLSAMPVIVCFVIVLTFLVLLGLLRAVPLALGAVLTNCLSVACAFGVLSLVFGRIDTIALPLVLAVVFGLSMDYQVFLLSRVRERRRAGASAEEAVRSGVAASARTITSAALIMVTVFTVFLITGVPVVQQVALGCAVAIALDATVVRLVFVPAAMVLAGERIWGRPAATARTQPHV